MQIVLGLMMPNNPDLKMFVQRQNAPFTRMNLFVWCLTYQQLCSNWIQDERYSLLAVGTAAVNYHASVNILIPWSNITLPASVNVIYNMP